MRTGSQAKSGRAPSPRVERRRQADRERILRIAAARFAQDGPERVRLEEIAEQAAVSRGTLYSHFASKEALGLELMKPLLDDAIGLLAEAEAARTARQRVSALLGVYLALWHRHPDALRMSHRMMIAAPPGWPAHTHIGFVGKVVKLLAMAHRAGLLRAPTPEVAGRTLARVAVPLLELYAPLRHGDQLFVEAVSGLLLKAPALKETGGL